MQSVFTLEGLSPQTLKLLGTPTDPSFWNTDQSFQALDTAGAAAQLAPGLVRAETQMPAGLPQAMAKQPQFGVTSTEYASLATAKATPRQLGQYGTVPSNVPSNPAVVYYPAVTGPHGPVVGPPRVPTYVYGPGGTPTAYGWTPPARGAISNYANPTPNMVALSGVNGLGHYRDYDDDGNNSIVPNWLAAGAGFALGALAVWMISNRG